jgi:D-hexose-6-phosphate mutarotase
MMTAAETLKHIEDLGRQRASKSFEIWDKHGITPEDSFVHKDMVIWNPWSSDCQRFEVDPYTEYGRPFIEWLLAPFYPENTS